MSVWPLILSEKLREAWRLDCEIYGQNSGYSGYPVVPVLYGAGAGAFNFNGRHGHYNDRSILNGEMR